MQDKKHEHDETKQPPKLPTVPKKDDPKKPTGPRTTADEGQPPAPPTGGLENDGDGDGDDQGN